MNLQSVVDSSDEDEERPLLPLTSNKSVGEILVRDAADRIICFLGMRPFSSTPSIYFQSIQIFFVLFSGLAALLISFSNLFGKWYGTSPYVGWNGIELILISAVSTVALWCLCCGNANMYCRGMSLKSITNSAKETLYIASFKKYCVGIVVVIFVPTTLVAFYIFVISWCNNCELAIAYFLIFEYGILILLLYGVFGIGMFCTVALLFVETIDSLGVQCVLFSSSEEYNSVRVPLTEYVHQHYTIAESLKNVCSAYSLPLFGGLAIAILGASLMLVLSLTTKPSMIVAVPIILIIVSIVLGVMARVGFASESLVRKVGQQVGLDYDMLFCAEEQRGRTFLMLYLQNHPLYWEVAGIMFTPDIIAAGGSIGATALAAVSPLLVSNFL